jgi:DNA-binding transcriptional LysR family regulator
LTVAANDFQRDLLLPTLFARIEAAVKRVTLRVIPSQSPTAALLRENRCDLLISPLPPTGADIMQKRLLQDFYVCFYDPRLRAPPASRADYLAARHVTVVYPDNERLNFDRQLAALGVIRDIAVSAPSFSGVPAFLRGSHMLASMPSLFDGRLMGDFAFAPIPLGRRHSRLVELPMYMAWHRRFHDDPAHVWLRRLLDETAAEVARSHPSER